MCMMYPQNQVSLNPRTASGVLSRFRPYIVIRLSVSIDLPLPVRALENFLVSSLACRPARSLEVRWTKNGVVCWFRSLSCQLAWLMSISLRCSTERSLSVRLLFYCCGTFFPNNIVARRCRKKKKTSQITLSFV